MCLLCRKYPLAVTTRYLPSKFRGCRSENDYLLCVCMHQAYGPLLSSLHVRSLAQHESTASIYAVLVAKTQRARQRKRESESELERESEREIEGERESV